MKSPFSWLVFLVLCIFISSARAAADGAIDDTTALEASMNEQVLSLPGDPDRPVMLQVTLLKPSGRGPFPLAVMNHGADGKVPPAAQPRYFHTFAAYYFLSRGYAVALPMMRGYAGSGGRLQLYRCDDITPAMNDARDISAVIDAMIRRPEIDGSRVVVAGQSFGGWNTLAVGALDIPNVRALVNFAGGMNVSNCAQQGASLIAEAGQLGARTIARSIWFYGDNDQTFGPGVWRGMYDRYTAAGGSAELVAYGNFMADAHQFLGYPESLHIWVPKLDAFLTKIGLPSREIHPEYLPMPVPPPSRYATIDDVSAVPYLNDQGRSFYLKYLAKALPRAIAIAPNGNASSTAGGFDPLAKALALCSRTAPDCRLYAVDNDVVWIRPTPAPPPTRFAALSDWNAVPFLNDKGRTGYQRFLTSQIPRAFVIAPDGAWFLSAGGADPLAAALGGCNQQHQGCRFYAVDSDVVWRGKP